MKVCYSAGNLTRPNGITNTKPVRYSKVYLYWIGKGLDATHARSALPSGATPLHVSKHLANLNRSLRSGNEITDSWALVRAFRLHNGYLKLTVMLAPTAI